MTNQNDCTVFALYGYDNLAQRIETDLNFEKGKISFHRFPDDEMLVRIQSSIQGKIILFVGSLDHPDSKIIPLILACETARTLGAKKIILISPYLPYMRQDQAFQPGEAISAKYFARLLSVYIDELITMDPHLHRFHSLNEIYSIQTVVLDASNLIANWIKQHQQKFVKPLLIGPDLESRQWVEKIAEQVNCPFVILKKIRKDDTHVEISIPNIENYLHHTPILIDDIISSGTTILNTAKQLQSDAFIKLHLKPANCIAIHGIFADDSFNRLKKSGLQNIVTCNTILHESNAIDVSSEFVKAIVSGNNGNIKPLD